MFCLEKFEDFEPGAGEKSFNDIFEIDFTAKMEDDLDEIATSKKDLIETLNEFYSYFHKNIVRESENKDLIKIIEKSEGPCPKCKKPTRIGYVVEKSKKSRVCKQCKSIL